MTASPTAIRIRFVTVMCFCLAASAHAKLGEAVPELIKRFGNNFTTEAEAHGVKYHFRSANVSVDAFVVKGVSVGETYFSDKPLNSKGEPPNEIVQTILRTNVPEARWHEIRTEWGDYGLQSDDHYYVAVLMYSGPQPENAMWTMVVARSEVLFWALPPTPSAPSPVAKAPPPPAARPTPAFDATIDWDVRSVATPTTTSTVSSEENSARQTALPGTRQPSVVDEIATLALTRSNLIDTLRNLMRQPVGFAVFIGTLLLYVVVLTKAFRRKTWRWETTAIVVAILLGVIGIAFLSAWRDELQLAWHKVRTPISAVPKDVTGPWKEYEQLSPKSEKVLTDAEVGITPSAEKRFTPPPLQSLQPLSPAEIARRAFPSVVLLSMQDTRGQPLCFGSGFFVEKNVVATNFHVIDQTGGGYANVVGESAKLRIQGTVGLDAVHDLALLKVDDSSAPSLPMVSKVSISVGEPVYAIGNPRGLEGTFSQGVVSSWRTFGSDRLLQMSAPISPGSSGGPVLDQNGSVVGVSVASIANGENLNFAIPADYVAALQTHETELRPLITIPKVKVHNTLLGRLGGDQPRTGVIGERLTYDSGGTLQWGDFSYSLRNKLNRPVANVYGIIVFYDLRGQPIDIYPIAYEGFLPSGLAKRITGKVDQSVEKLNCPANWTEQAPRSPKGKVEFRIFDFTME